MDKGQEFFGTVYEKGEAVFRQGDHGDTMFVIQSGAVQISRSDKDKEVTLAVLERGDFFGEMALLDSRPRSASVKTIQRSRLLPLTRQTLLTKVKDNPAILMQLLATLSVRIEKTNRMLRGVVGGRESLRRALASVGTLKSKAVSKATHSTGESEHDVPLIETVSMQQETATIASGQEASIYHVESERSSSEDLYPNQDGLEGLPFPAAQLGDCWFEAGQDVFRQGDVGDKLYFISEGEVEISHDCEGERCRLALLGPGDFFGEMAIITGAPRVAYAAAASRARLLPVSREQFMDQVIRYPELGLYMVQTLILRLRETNKALEDPRRSLELLQKAMPPVISRERLTSTAVVSLSACGGCGASLVNDPEELGRLTGMARIVYCPMLMDEEHLGEVTLAVVDGIVRVKEDVEKLLEARARSKFLVAWGTCAAYGGIPALADDYELEDLIEGSYGQTVDPLTFYMSCTNGPRTPLSYTGGDGLLRHTGNLSDFVRVDYFIPGCPPNPALLTNLVMELRREPHKAENKQIVCTQCPRKPTKSELDRLRLFPGTAWDSKTCLLSLGSICLGFTTKGGCGAPCTTGGLPCWGCRGPSESTLKKLDQGDYFEEVTLAALGKRCKLPTERLITTVRDFRQKTASSHGFESRFVKDSSRLR